MQNFRGITINILWLIRFAVGQKIPASDNLKITAAIHRFCAFCGLFRLFCFCCQFFLTGNIQRCKRLFQPVRSFFPCIAYCCSIMLECLWNWRIKAENPFRRIWLRVQFFKGLVNCKNRTDLSHLHTIHVDSTEREYIKRLLR